MFERYTEKARRIIFFARYEASQFGSPYIESEHLLLGILRENKATTTTLLGPMRPRNPSATNSASAREVRAKSRLLSICRSPNVCKRVLAYAAEEAEGSAISTLAPNTCC